MAHQKRIRMSREDYTNHREVGITAEIFTLMHIRSLSNHERPHHPRWE